MKNNMKSISLTKAKSGLRGEIVSPPDKSLSHRAVFIASMAKGVSVIKNFLMAGDPLSTVHAFSSLGVQIGMQQDGIEVHGCGLDGFSEPWNIIDCGNSGTTMRLLTGVLASRPFFSVLTGDDSLRNRPMSRVILPLKQMQAEIYARGNDRLPPIAIKGCRLTPITYDMPVASAQVKSAVLLAGLSIDGGYTEVTEPIKSRDHTERMLSAFGADVRVDGLRVGIKGGANMTGRNITLPGDFSSAAFFITAAIITEDSQLSIKQTGINPTRIGFLDVIREMGANVETQDVQDLCGEPTATLLCKFTGGLKPFKIGKDRVPSLIDEFPLLCLLATQAHGVSVIRDAKELRVKESDRIAAMVLALEGMGASVEEYDDGVAIEGPVQLKGARIQSYNDHRIAMTCAVAALIADGETIIDGADAAEISFPDFYTKLNRLAGL
ncbi:MAG: 3-phosphoshikimate 1-carboxyvinyltransferase [Candidatus Magnetobacterium sp. LHC-1]